MATIVMNIDGCDIAHEALMLEEYGEEKTRAEWKPQLAPAGDGPVARINRHANGQYPSASEEEIESFVLVPSTAFPQCP
jgi:hypothetical protein